MTTHTLVTAEDLLAHRLAHAGTELVRGRLIVRGLAGYAHGLVASKALVAIAAFANEHKLGHVLAAETGFTLHREPDTVRSPDVAFVSNARVPEVSTLGFPELAPDLVVEVLTPDDLASEMREKVREWLAAGTQLVWTIDPTRRSARIYRIDGTTRGLTPAGRLDGELVLPGFSIVLRDLLT
jgi:Uma2 family endonuclease